jgi:hypothetical protein
MCTFFLNTPMNEYSYHTDELHSMNKELHGTYFLHFQSKISILYKKVNVKQRSMLDAKIQTGYLLLLRKYVSRG